jgi:hypothetical protein
MFFFVVIPEAVDVSRENAHRRDPRRMVKDIPQNTTSGTP